MGILPSVERKLLQHSECIGKWIEVSEEEQHENNSSSLTQNKYKTFNLDLECEGTLANHHSGVNCCGESMIRGDDRQHSKCSNPRHHLCEIKVIHTLMTNTSQQQQIKADYRYTPANPRTGGPSSLSEKLSSSCCRNHTIIPPQSLPLGIHLHKAVYLNSRIYVFGGSTRKELNSNCFLEYDVENEKWKRLSTLISSPFIDENVSYSSAQTSMTGSNANPPNPSLDHSTLNASQPSCSSSNGHNNMTPQRAVPMYLNPCFYHSLCVCKKRRKIYVFGGRTNSVVTSNNLYEFDVDKQQWNVLTPIRNNSKQEKLPKREGHSAFVRDDFLYIVAGYEYNTDQYSNEIIEINLETNTWRYLSEDYSKKAKRGGHRNTPKIATSGHTTDSDEEYNDEHDTSTMFTKVAYHCSEYCESRDELLIYGGKTREKPFGPLSNNLYVYSFKRKEWTLYKAPSLLRRKHFERDRHDNTLTTYLTYDDHRQFIMSYNKSSTIVEDRYFVICNGLINDHFDRRHYIDEMIIIDIYSNTWYKVSDGLALSIPFDSCLVYCDNYNRVYSIGGYNPCAEKPHLPNVTKLEYKITNCDYLKQYVSKISNPTFPIPFVTVTSHDRRQSFQLSQVIAMRLFGEEFGNIRCDKPIIVETPFDPSQLSDVIDYLHGSDIDFREVNDILELLEKTIKFPALGPTLDSYLLRRLETGLITEKNVTCILKSYQHVPRVEMLCLSFLKRNGMKVPINDCSELPKIILTKLEQFKQTRHCVPPQGTCCSSNGPSNISGDVKNVNLKFSTTQCNRLYLAEPMPTLLVFLRSLRKDLDASQRTGDLTLFIHDQEKDRVKSITLDSAVAVMTSKFFERMLSAGFEERGRNCIELLNPVTLNENDLINLVDLLYLTPPSRIDPWMNKKNKWNYIYRIADFYCLDIITAILEDKSVD
ncbi:hypothetical protein FDP41_006187 [Naegleria fowleri]|uniref:BTB domain-containing protein n=1 Tax=Naegleria fowleri TaxID=5763 RepID=A0A6A5B8Y9_NAEFO|nr:uncharacterized protein FDP41_006187 [Naegleria fowleri]KAF0974713.1 hypothetical protein FDP41_006187 [Naegleria fowleri]